MFHTQQTRTSTAVGSCAEPEPQGLRLVRRDRRRGALITLAGDIDLDSAPQMRHAVNECLQAGIRSIDFDLTHVAFCDVSGLNAFLGAARQTTAASGRLRLENLCPMLTRLLTLTDTHVLLTAPAHDAPARLHTGARISKAVRGLLVPAARTAGPPDDQ